MKKPIFFFIFLPVFLFLTGFIYINFIKRTQGFSVKKIQSKHQYSPRWDFGQPTLKQLEILNMLSSEPFFLIGSGRECYAFVNESGTLVIKLFKQQRMRTQSILNHIPLPKHLKLLHQEITNCRKYQRDRTFTSYQIAYEQFSNQTEILYLHLNKTNNLKRNLFIIDSNGKKHTLEMDNLEFIVQKRAYPIIDSINSYMKNQDEPGAKSTISSILNLITKRLELGILDNDINCERNLGLVDNKPIHIDVGEFYSSIPSQPKYNDFTSATDDLYRFLETQYPSLAIFLKNEIDQRVKLK